MRNKEEATTLCQLCPKLCHHSCPVSRAENDEASSPWGKMTTLKLVTQAQLPMTQETMKAAYQCVDCHASQSACEMDNPVSQSLHEYRAMAFKAGLAPDSIVQHSKKFNKYNNPTPVDLLKNLRKNFPSPDFSNVSQKKREAYFPGCTEIVQSPQSITRTFEVLKKAKVTNVGLYSESIQCCGYPLYAAGDWESFREIAEINSQALGEYGNIITGSARCLYTFKVLYPLMKIKVPTRFSHLIEFLEGKMTRLPKACKNSLAPAYHDPCTLGRVQGVYESPRRLIEKVSGRPPREFFYNREESHCCGAGGLLSVSNPKTAKKITVTRIEEFKATGAKELVTGCSDCTARFREFGIEAKNMIDYLAENL